MNTYTGSVSAKIKGSGRPRRSANAAHEPKTAKTASISSLAIRGLFVLCKKFTFKPRH